jgi:hypothetical protein
VKGPPVLVYVVGEPGVGKSTAMAAATAGYLRTAVPAGRHSVARDILIHPRTYFIVGAELGRRRAGFPGTDTLPMNVCPAACRYVAGRALDETPLLLGEGARLGNRRFLTAAVDGGWKVHLVHIFGAAAAAARREARGSQQNSAWVKGSATAAARLASQPPPKVTVHYVDTADDPAGLIAELAALPALVPLHTTTGGTL